MSLVWRIPLAVVALVLAWQRLGAVRPVLASVAGVALLLDAALPAAVAPDVWAARASEMTAGIQRRLELLAESQALRRTLAAGGGEATPEAPFDELRRSGAGLLPTVDELLLVDERGEPVAWAGERAQMPFRLRLLGERAVAAEPGVQEAWLWWREPIFEGGRIIGEVLAGVVVPERGARTVLGVGAGRAAVVSPRWEGGTSVTSPAGARLFGIEIKRAGTVPWSLAGGAALVTVLLLAVRASGPARALLAGVAAAVALAGAEVAEWRAVAVVLAVGALLMLASALSGRKRAPGSDPSWPVPLLGALSVAALAWLAPSAITGFSSQVTPDRLLLPSPWQVAIVASWTFLLLASVPLAVRLHWGARVVAWGPLVAGVLLADPRLLAAGAALVVLVGRRRSSLVLPAIAAALIVAGAEDAGRRDTLTSGVESTLQRMENQEGPARALLASVPESGLAELVRLAPAERVVVLGRLAGWLGFTETLPGASLALIDPQEAPVAVWGQSLGAWEPQPRELASRGLASGWRVSVLAAQRPYDVLEALSAAGVEAPTAAFDRAGAPLARGATFRPLPPERVGRALAEGRSWSWISVGEREHRAYLRTYHSWVLAVPWVRSPLPELALATAGLALWGVLPFAIWSQRRRARELWSQRRTFAGRLRALSAVVTLVPLLLLAQLLPRQWLREQQRARLELGRALSQPLAALGVEQQLPWLARDLGATVAIYRAGRLTWCSRPDLVAAGEVPWLAPPEAFVRAVRGWREPLVMGEGRLSVFAPTSSVPVPEVGAILGLQIGAGAPSYSPREWFVITALWAAVLALAMSERVGRRLARPLRRLVHATRRLERGESVAGVRIDGDDEVMELSGAFRTMASTVQRREEELRRERDLLESVLGTLSAAVLVLSSDGGCELANASARRLLGDADPLGMLHARLGTAIDGMLDGAASTDRPDGTDPRDARGVVAGHGHASPRHGCAAADRDGGPLRGRPRGAAGLAGGARSHRRTRGEEPADPDQAVGGGAAGRARGRSGAAGEGGRDRRRTDPGSGGTAPRCRAGILEPGRARALGTPGNGAGRGRPRGGRRVHRAYPARDRHSRRGRRGGSGDGRPQLGQEGHQAPAGQQHPRDRPGQRRGRARATRDRCDGRSDGQGHRRGRARGQPRPPLRAALLDHQ
jgi:HAMP domain-containing protein